MASSSTSSYNHQPQPQHTDIFDPRIAFPATTDSLLNGLRANFNQHIDWLDGYLQQVKEADVLRVKSSNIPSLRGSPSSHSNTGHGNDGLWVNILKSPARKRLKESSQRQDEDLTSSKPISTLTYTASTQSKQKNIFSTDFTTSGTGREQTSIKPLSNSAGSSNSLSRSPAKSGLKSLANVSTTCIEDDKENAPSSNSFSRSTSFNRLHGDRQLYRSATGTTPKRNVLSATTTTTTAAARSPGIRSPLQSSTSKTQRQTQVQSQGGSTRSSNLSASAPASPLRSPGLSAPRQPPQAIPQSPLTRSQRLTQTTSEADASPYTSTASASASRTAQGRQISPSPTPRPASRVLRSPTASTNHNSAPASPRLDVGRKLLSPLAAGLSKIATPTKGARAASGSRINGQGNTSASTTPVREVDDVFTLPSTNTTPNRGETNTEEEEVEDSKGTDFDDDDEEEIENILLGYTKTPATSTSNKVLKSDAVRNGATSSTGHANVNAASKAPVSVVVEIPIKEKALPAIPQQSTNTTNRNAQAQASRISPPRPAKSPARPVPASMNNNINNAGKGIVSNMSPSSKVIRPTAGGAGGQYRNHSPVKRDMSHLASIASLLSPTKARGEETKRDTASGGEISRPASPQFRSHSKVPVPQSTNNSAANSPARPRSPALAARGAVVNNASAATTASPDSRPVSPSRISSRIAALAGAARGVSSSREASPKVAHNNNSVGLQPQPSSPRFGLTRSPRLKQALRMDSPSSSIRPREAAATASGNQISNAASVHSPAPSGLPTPTKMKRPMLSPIQSPNSQRALALSSLRKAVPGFETNAFTSPPASPRMPSTNSLATNIHHFPSVHSAKDTVRNDERIQIKADVQAQSQLQKDEELITQHAQAISALGKTLPPPPSPIAHTSTAAKAKPSGLSPPAKSPLRKLNSQLALNAQIAASSPSTTSVQAEKTMAPTPAKDANETVMPQTVVKKFDHEAVHSTAHKDSTVDIPPPSPVFSSFLSNNKRTSTLSFAGLPGRTFGGPNGREKSIGLGLGLGKSLGATSTSTTAAKERLAQAEEQDSQGSNTNGHTRQSFYTAALASQSRKRLSSTLAHTGVLGSAEADSQSSKASRTDFSHTARSSILASQLQQQQQQPMSQSARFDLLRSRISNIKGTTGYVAPSSASLRTSIATSAQTAPIPVSQSIVNSTSSKPDAGRSERPDPSHYEKTFTASSLFSPPAHSISGTAQKDASTITSSATSTFAATIASFVPAPAFGTSFASLFGAGALRATKPDSPAKNTHETAFATSAGKKGALYPSLPSMNNLNLPLASSTSPEKKLHSRDLMSDTDEEQIEELASPLAGEDIIDRARSILPSSPPAMQRHRSSSVQSIVDAIEAKEAESRQKMQREASLSPRKLSGIQSVPIHVPQVTRAAAPRSTTPTFSPPKQELAPRLSFEDKEGRIAPTSRPESRLSDMLAMPVPDDECPDMSIAGLVDIEDPGLDAIPRASFSDDTELPTTDAVSETEDEDMDQADDEADFVGTTTRQVEIDGRLHSTDANEPQHSAVPKQFRPNTAAAGNLSKSTFKPTRPNKETSEIQRPVHRPASRALSVSSLAPSRASTVSLASISSFNPSRPGTAMSNTNRKAANLSISTNARPEIKSLQNAAAAAKKEQVERERKAAVKEERDQKRAAFLAAKREEQDSQASQGDRNGVEKKRKERDDLNSSMAASSQGSTVVKAKTVVKTTKTIVSSNKGIDEQTKKRKMDGIEVVVHKPSVPKTTVTRPAPIKAASGSQSATTNMKQASTSTSNTKALAASVNSIGIPKQAPTAGPSRLAPQASSSKTPLYPTKPGGNQQALLSQHQQAILSASAAFGKSQIAAKATTSQQPVEPEEPEVEPFQLPEIDSEYSDSDEDVQAQKAALRPVWTHSPELRQALAVQATFDPDQLFGEMPALRMEEIFKNPATMARLRHRTSSAHWSGPDAISRYEEKEYAKRMGFKRVQEEEAREAGPSTSKR